MATSNFYQDGNHGLNVIYTDYEEAVEDTLDNIVAELSSKRYDVDSANHLTQVPRSFETGLGYLVVTPKGKYVAFLEVCAGYYHGANINIYTGREYLDDLINDGREYKSDITENKRDIDKVVKCVKAFTDGYKRTALFSSGEAIYERL